MPQYGEDFYPVRVEADYPERSSRAMALAGLLVFPKYLLLIPHAFLLFFVQIAASFVIFLGFLVVLFTGRYPRGMFEFLLGTLRWQTRVGAWFMGLTDKYPPFGLK